MTLTPQIQHTILSYIEAGAFDYIAAEAAGIDERTFRDWMARGEGRHPDGQPIIAGLRLRCDRPGDRIHTGDQNLVRHGGLDSAADQRRRLASREGRHAAEADEGMAEAGGGEVEAPPA